MFCRDGADLVLYTCGQEGMAERSTMTAMQMGLFPVRIQLVLRLFSLDSLFRVFSRQGADRVTISKECTYKCSVIPTAKNSKKRITYA